MSVFDELGTLLKRAKEPKGPKLTILVIETFFVLFFGRLAECDKGKQQKISFFGGFRF